MDMLEVRGKSKKNVTACILLTPDVKSAINVLVETRSSSLVSVPRDNKPIKNPHWFIGA